MNIDASLVVVVALPVILYSSYVSQLYFVGDKLSIFSKMIYLLLGGFATAFLAVKIWRLLKERHSLYLALDCELAVGQELNQLMLEGCRVYHDFPAEKFNIDHVIVGPKGVFAVETKGRAKPDKKGGSEEATVTYDGEKLNFPGRKEKDPLDQAKRQAVWLSQWLSSAVGEPVSVHPGLAIPGWYIKLQKPADIFIFNGKNPDLLLKWKKDALTEPLIKRVAHQLDQRCRDVEPAAYKKADR